MNTVDPAMGLAAHEAVPSRSPPHRVEASPAMIAAPVSPDPDETRGTSNNNSSSSQQQYSLPEKASLPPQQPSAASTEKVMEAPISMKVVHPATTAAAATTTSSSTERRHHRSRRRSERSEQRRHSNNTDVQQAFFQQSNPAVEKRAQRSFFSAVRRSLTPDRDMSRSGNTNNATPEGLQRPVAVRIAPPPAAATAVHRPVPMRVIFPSHHAPSTPAQPNIPVQQQQQQLQSKPLVTPLAQPSPSQQHADPSSADNEPSTATTNSWDKVPRRRKKKKSPDQKYKMIKASWYHSVASKNRLGAITEDPVMLSDSDAEAQRLAELRRGSWHFLTEHQKEAKRALLKHLNHALGESHTPEFQNALQQLLSTYDPSHFNPRSLRVTYVGSVLEGIGISAGKPTFPGCIGFNQNGDPMYKLGTMSFDMFLPTQLVLSVQGTFVLIDGVDPTDPEQVKYVPSNLVEEVRTGDTPVRTYNIVTACTIEPYRPDFGEQSPNKEIDEPIQGVLTTYGYILPYPKGYRFSVWFTGGSLEVDGKKNEKWFQLFSKNKAPKRTFFESGKVLAAKVLMGASTNDTVDESGKLTYTLSRPMASHIDLLYLDHRMQIFRGSSGTIYVHVRIPGSHAVHQCRASNDLLPVPKNPVGDDEDDDSSTGSDSDDEHWTNLSSQAQRQRALVRPVSRKLSSGSERSNSQVVVPPSQPVQSSSIQSTSSFNASERT